ncbi:MAG: hypothetical protein ACOC16_02950 [Nanoarchaeota archaeon]
MKNKSYIENGSKRIKTDKKIYIKKHNKWIFFDNISNKQNKIIQLYEKNNLINILIDNDDPEFFKGYINSKKHICGKRINILPSNKKLARGGFSLFAKNLEINTKSFYQWDICFENESGLKTYLYNEDKIHIEKEKKAQIVDEFIISYQTIIKKLKKDIQTKKKFTKYLALYTLIKTLIRVGNIEYYILNSHKGLTTLQKKDITIKNDNKIIFEFIGKDGIPQKHEIKFENFYIEKLNQILNEKKENDFIFTNSKGEPLHSITFTKILYQYTNKHFYPHIIRSYYADTKCLHFIKKHKKTTKQEVDKIFLYIAKKLGHKKYNKKKQIWEICPKVVLTSYIRPKYIEDMKKLYQKDI